MGHNTTLLILNDALKEIEEDPDFGKNLGNAIREVCLGRQVDISAKSKHCTYANAATVIETHHANIVKLIAIGGNQAKELGSAIGCWQFRDDQMKYLLEVAAKKLGYKLIKLSKKELEKNGR